MSVLSVITFSFKGYTESALIHRGSPAVISNMKHRCNPVWKGGDFFNTLTLDNVKWPHTQ